MQKRSKCASVDHQSSLRAIHQPVDIQIETIGDEYRHLLKSAEIESRCHGRHIRLQIQNEKLALAIQNRSAGEQHVRSKNPICLAFVQHASGATGSSQVGGNGWDISDGESTETQRVRYHQCVI